MGGGGVPGKGRSGVGGEEVQGRAGGHLPFGRAQFCYNCCRDEARMEMCIVGDLIHDNRCGATIMCY